jgi:ATP-dependent DNA helicase RecQ
MNTLQNMETTAPSPSPLDILRNTFGHQAFRPGQEKIIQAVLAGKDCIGVMPTGAGKSLTFQLPAKLLGGTVLVISPLLSLMKDQVDGLLLDGFKAAAINSTLTPEERRERMETLRLGGYELAYLAPEALEGSLRDFLKLCPIKLLVVDEAHCISHWGHEFRPAYRKLQGLKAELGNVPVLALTATATRAVAADIIRQLGMSKPEGYKGSFLRKNLRITCQKKGGGRNTRQDIWELVRRLPGQSGVIYCLSRKAVESTAEFLRSRGVKALPYHAGLSDEERRRNQEAFAKDDVDVIVATVAFGMGIDKSNVRYVVHRDMPKSLENYYQEIGRAGRDGLAAACVLFYSWSEVVSYERFFAPTDPAAAEAASRKTREMFNWAERRECRHKGVTAHFEETIEPCGDACDVCRNSTFEDLLGRLPAPAPAPRGPAAPAAAAPVADDDPLFLRLKALRRSLADAQGVPAYIVFNDAVLRQMADRRPRTEEELLALSGVGPAKLKRYGKAFLEAISASPSPA